jgi:filamentous hemagglutinin
MMGTIAQADVSLRAGNMTGSHGTGSSGAAATSQTASAATTAASQAQQTATVTANAQAALSHSLQALQALQKAQSAARLAAIAGMNNLGADPNHPGQQLPNVSDGLGTGALMPTGGLTTTPNPAIQVVQLANNNTVTLGQGGTVVLPTGTTGNDAVTVTGAGSVSGGTVTATAGSVTTSSGGTLATTTGGTVTVSGAGSTLTYSSATSISSTLAGTITLPNGGGTVALAADQTAIVPAGGTLAFSGSSAATVSMVGPGTVTLTGAGTLALANVGTAAAGGTITTRSGTTSFTSGATTSVAAGNSINLTGSGTLDFTSSSGDDIPVLLPGTSNAASNPAANFTTTGTLLSTTGYQVPTSWTNIGALSQTSNASTGQITDTITQSAQQALLYWNTFNIGKNTTLDFDQSAGGANVGQWVAINEIEDPSLSPSQILGSIEAPGQVYVINQNGIIFGGSSQVNTHGLVASSLALNPDYISDGLLNDNQNNFEFQFSALVAATTQLTGAAGHQSVTTTVAPLWTAPSTAPGVTQTVFAVPTGNVTVQAGAQLSSPTDDNNDGGQIALIAPNVINDGTISTPDGQTILAAGLQVGLAAHNANDPTLRGLDVFIGQVSAPAGTLPTGTFTFNGLPGNGELSTGMPGNNQLTLSGTGQVGTYTPTGGVATPIQGGVATAIPVGSSVTLTGGTQSFAAVSAGTATNAANVLDGQGNIVTPGGDIEATEADVTMAGATVDQFGLVDGSTSVTLNGRIDLLADYNAQAGTLNGVTSLYPLATGTVNFGSTSVTQILPELSSDETTIGTQLALSSLVNVQGQTLEMDPGALLLAPSAQTPASGSALDLVGETLTSGVTFNAGTWFPIGTTVGQITTLFSNSTGQILLDDGSTIDVSGSENVSASLAEDIIAVQLRGPELADSTLQQDGALRGTTVYVDVRDAGVDDGTAWIGTPVGDVSGYANDIERTVGELTVSGGTVALNAGTSIAMQNNATINVSGGWINYAGATVQTTKVIMGGQIIDISDATPDQVYDGIYQGVSEDSPKYGLTVTYTNSLLNSSTYEAGYVQGGNGGTVAITAPTATLQGNFEGNTVDGALQLTPLAQLESTYAGASFLPTTEAISGVPKAATFDLAFLQLTANDVAKVYGASSPDITFESAAVIAQTTPSSGQILLPSELINTDGFGNISIDTSSSGTITVPASVSLSLSSGGSLAFSAANIDIEGALSANGGGSMAFTVFDVSSSIMLNDIGTTPADDPTRGNLVVGSGASLDATGLIVDDRVGNGITAIDGGTISLAGLDMDLQPGSSIDVSGGVLVSATNQESYGAAGAISILGAQDPAYGSIVQGGSLILGSTLRGYSGLVGGSGSLTVQAPLVQIGGASLQNGDINTASLVAGATGVVGNGTTLWLNSAGSGDFFSTGGFGSFDVEGLGQIETDGAGHVQFDSAGNPLVSPAVLVTAGTVVAPTAQMTLAQITSSGINLAPITGNVASLLLPSQRTAVNLILDAEGVTSSFSGDGPPQVSGVPFQNSGGGGGLVVRGDLVLDDGAEIVTDPQTNSAHGVALVASHGTVAVLGQVTAPGGTIKVQGGSTVSLSSNDLLFYNSSPNQPFPTVDLGPDSVLSTAGVTEQTYNGLGYYTGSVLAGGSIDLGGNIVAESGAVLDVSGSTGVLDETTGARGLNLNTLNAPLYALTRLDSNGGTITFDASQLLLSDATLLGAAGGSTAQGGSLSVSAGFTDTVNPNNSPPQPGDVTLVVTQQGINGGYALPAGFGTGLDVVRNGAVADPITVPGGEVDSYFVANPNLFVTTGADSTVTDNGGHAGGFAALTLNGTVDFLGPVSITTDRSISVALSSGNVNTGEQGGVIYADAPVTLTAPYVALNLDVTSVLPDVVAESSYPAATGGSGTLTIHAGTLADVGNLSLQDIGELDFNTGASAGDIRGDGTLQVAGQINLNAAQIYPPTADVFTIDATGVSITAPVGQTLPALPISGGGTINIEANTIVQGGVLRAPLGTINLGTSGTQSVTLLPGSITSVSAVDPTTGLGITIPYGIVDANGDWFDPNGNDITVSGNGASGLPAKEINLAGGAIDVQTGATLDVSGGGDLYGYQFLPGTGGNIDILASASSFAIIPGYGAAYAPDGTYGQSSNLVTNGATDTGYYNPTLAVGQEIYLQASNGLAAGYYTLLPARYALLPGAYLVTPQGASPTAPAIQQPDGSSLVAGYVTSALDPSQPGIDESFAVASQAIVLTRAPYTGFSANSFFAASAASHDIAVPRLPQDAGQLVLNASQAMTLDGTLVAQAGAGGLGSEVDIASAEPIYILGPDAMPVSGALDLDSSQLTDFGAGSLLIGGYRTQTNEGTEVTVTTSDLVVDNAGASTVLDGTTVDGLAAPDLTLVSNLDLTVAAGAVIEQFGELPGSAETLLLGDGANAQPGAGNGTLLRVSSDSSAQSIRQNVNSLGAAPLLSIGAGAIIERSGGGAVGALTLDSTAGLSVNTTASLAPILNGNTLTLDSGLINIELATPTTAPTTGLVVTEPELQSLLASTQSLAFLSYSSIALYGSGEIGGASVGSAGQAVYQESSLALHADSIYYADTTPSSGITINAQSVSLDNLPGGATLPALTGLASGNLTINAQTINLGSGSMQLEQFGTVALNASNAVLITGTGTQASGSDAAPIPSSLNVSGNLVITTPMITDGAVLSTVNPGATSAPDVTISASGDVTIAAPASSPAAASPGGLDGSLAITGADVTMTGGEIALPSGTVNLKATSGDLVVNGQIDAGGIAQTFFNLNKYTDGGSITLGAAAGNVTLGSGSVLNVSPASGIGTVDSLAGNAGSLTISAPQGVFTAGGVLDGSAGQVTATDGTVLAQGTGGNFTLDAAALPTSDLAPLEILLTPASTLSGVSQAGGFNGSQSIRLRDESITVDGLVAAQDFALSTDQGSITVSGEIVASAPQVGGIETAMQNGLLENPGAIGGTITLSASGSINLLSGSLLSVAAQSVDDAGEGGSVSLAAGAATATDGTVNIDSSAQLSVAAGAVVDLRVLQTNRTLDGSLITGVSGTLLLSAPQTGSVNAPTGVQINPVLGTIAGASAITIEGYQVYEPAGGMIDNVEDAIEANGIAFFSAMGTQNAGMSPLLAGAVLTGSSPVVNVEPGAEIIDPTGDLVLENSWDLSGDRFGVNSVGQALPGILTLRAAGNIDLDFGASLSDGFAGTLDTWPLLSVGSLSWAYQITSGADLAAADLGAVQSTVQLASSGSGGSLLVGYQDSSNPILLSDFTTNSISEFFQTIRTGTGDITIHAGGDVQLLDNLATIYTAGSEVDGTLGGTFTPPAGTSSSRSSIPATYSDAGGNVSVTAQGNIAHYTYSADGSTLVADSSAELPTSWLDREGSVSAGQVILNPTWWVDFTNFFEGIGALGGGNVALDAGGSVINVDAVAPTNARVVNGQATELGGGDVTVHAGVNIDGGVYYVERGTGTLTAGDNIQTNATRAAVALGQPSVALDWLPTTLFLGEGNFNVSAGDNLLLGPVANPFLLPQSLNNIASTRNFTSELSYFSTYATTDAVNVSSLAGTVTVQDNAVSGQGSLYDWYTNIFDAPIPGELSDYEPWLKLAEAATSTQNVVADFAPAAGLTGSPEDVFGGFATLLPATLRITAYTGDLDLIGGLTLAPSPTGTLDLAVEGSINAFEVGETTVAGTTSSLSASSVINVSDADPAALPTFDSPLASGSILNQLSSLFTETGATEDITLQQRQALHDDNNGNALHADDSSPVYIYAVNGDISGLTAFTPKATQIIAGMDITDIGFYLQNNGADDVSLVQAGRDIIAYEASSPLRVAAGNNLLGYNSLSEPVGAGLGAPNSGDIQISGPGTLEVLAGRNLTLGDDSGRNPNDDAAGDGLFTGLTSVGNEDNPTLPFAGADLVAAAGLGADGFSGTSVDFTTFETEFLDPATTYGARYLPDLAAAMGLNGESNQQVSDAFDALPKQEKDTLALQIFYLVLRDAGRDHNLPGTPGSGNYAAGNQAIAALFPATYGGDIDLTSREIKTANGGNISVLAPGGQLTVGIEDPSAQAIDQGILTVDGGDISVFANGNINVGSSRIFTLHGGNIVIWSSTGNIGAGASSKTVVSAPPTRVVVDPTSGNVTTDLAGLATGGGIGVLASIVGAPVGDVDLIAPEGIVDAGDAGIRATGNLNIAAVQVLNASNISVGGKSAGVPSAPSLNIGAIAAASSVAGSTQQAASNTTPNRQSSEAEQQETPSIISVDVLGYGGGDEG